MNHLPSVAREALERYLDEKHYIPQVRTEPSKGVFVTLWSLDGNLRGCIGHISPSEYTLEKEVSVCALAAGTQDPRFPPVTRDELDSLKIEISVLDAPEPVESKEALDPRRFGVIVEKHGRRGLLLPGIDGVDTVDVQISIALQKAGIAWDETVQLFRFSVTKIEEKAFTK